jgi:hypothetical protein
MDSCVLQVSLPCSTHESIRRLGGGFMLARDQGIIHLPAVSYLCELNGLLSRPENALAKVESG